MKKLVEKIACIFRKEPLANTFVPSDESVPSIIGCWQIVCYSVAQGEEEKPRWKEIWSFAAMDEAETNGIYVCEYINLHSVIGKWELCGNRIKLIRKEQVCEYIVEELSADALRLKSADTNEYISSIRFEKTE